MQAIVIVIESMHEKTEEDICKLLKSLFDSFIITLVQMKNVSIHKHQNYTPTLNDPFLTGF